jgi:hypothetical protein
MRLMESRMRQFYLFPILLALSACARVSEDQPSHGAGSTPADAVAGAQEYAAFEVSWPRPSSAEVEARARSLSETLLDQKVSERPFAEQLASASLGSVSFSAVVGSSSTLVGRYRRGPDELLLNNRELQQDWTSEPAIAESAARTRFVETMRRLAAVSMIDESLYDLNQAIVSRTVVGSGSSDTSGQVEQVQSYDFLVRQSLNGIPFVNSGVRVSVHRSGAIASMRLGGARASATWEGARLRPRTPGYVFRGTVDEKSYHARFVDEFPAARISSSGVLYMLPMSEDPEAGGVQVLEPKYVFGFSNRTGGIVNRRRYVAYSLSEPAKPVEDLTPAGEPDAPGDPRPDVTTPALPNGSVAP